MGVQPSPGRQTARLEPFPPQGIDGSIRQHTLYSPASLSNGATSSPQSHSREPSLTRSGQTSVPLRPGTTKGTLTQDGGLERRPSASYGHHRQTSIVHGVQHSRNASFVNSPTTSPLSPHITATASVESGPGMGQQDMPELPQNPMLLGASNGVSGHATPASTPGSDRNASDHSGSSNPPQRRLERMHSGKMRRDHSHHHSHSRLHPETKTVGEFALHHLFNSFVGAADQKISECTALPLEPEPQLEDICGPGVDPNFDQLITALGHIARQKPKPLIDTLMFWRKAKSDAANNMRMEAVSHSTQQRATPPSSSQLPRRNTDPLHSLSDSMSSSMTLVNSTMTSVNSTMTSVNSTMTAVNSTASPSMASPQYTMAHAERRSAVSIYLLCRVLMEVIGQSSLASVTFDTADRLEDVIFSQLKAADLDQLSASPLKMSHWKIFGQLLGVMSEIHFESVARRFFRELEKLQVDFVRGGANRDLVEGKMELVILGMSHLRVKTSPQDAWDRTGDFMLRLGRFFADSHGQRIKYAYCRILEKLLMPIAATATAELDCVKWRAVIDTISPKVSQMLTKPRHWVDAFPVVAVLLCASPAEIFAQQWLQTVLPLQAKLKDRLTRSTALQAMARIMWTYLYRTDEVQNSTLRKLEEVIRMIHPTGKRSYLSTEPSIAEPLIQLIRIIGYSHQEICFKYIIFPMINSELFNAGKDLKVEQLEPEKMVIGIRSFLAILSDLEKGTEGRPPFPEAYGGQWSTESVPLPSIGVSHPVETSATGLVIREERLSRPVHTADLNKSAREYYARFCEILGKITLICDDTFGGQAALDEKFGAQTPKTPIADTFSFSRKDDLQGQADQKQGFYDLLHVAVQALPRCLSADIPFNSLVNLLCTGTAHLQTHIATSSAQSLRSIARQSHAQPVTIGFARFIFNFDDRYSTMSDGGMLGPGHIENTLKLYVELLQIWIDEIKQKTRDAAADGTGAHTSGKRGAQLDLSAAWAHVDEIESHGLFFLCSQSRRVRSFAVTVLRLVTEFDTALGKDNVRIIHIMEGESSAVLDFNDQHLSVAERSRLQRGIRNGRQRDTLIELCGSDVSYDSTLWYKIFPNLVRVSFERCPFATTLSREIICTRLLLMHKGISTLSETSKGSFDMTNHRNAQRLSPTTPAVMIEQWKLYLIFACTTLTNTGAQVTTSLQDSQHVRKISKSSYQGQEKIASARSLFQFVIPLLAVGSTSIRDAVVIALGSINVNSYRTLLDSLQAVVALCNDEGRTRLHQRTASSPRRSRRTDRLRTEVTHVYKLTSPFLRDPAVAADDAILQNLITYTNDLKLFLSDAEVQNDWEFQKLRRHYCGLMEELFEGINRTADPARWMPFEARKSAFALMEDWCGYSPNQAQIRQREEEMRRMMAESQRAEGKEKATGTAAMEIEKRDLRTAALSAMAALCGGPVSITTERKSSLQFDVRRMLTWINSIFDTQSDRMQGIGRRALKNLIVHNKEYPYLLERSIQMCYLTQAPKALESYFEVVCQVLLEHRDYPLAFWKILGAGLFILGNEKSELRSKAAQLLRTLEERQHRFSKIQDYDIGISDKTTAVYKLAQFEISRRLATEHSELAFMIFSEFTIYFKSLGPIQQRSMVAAILPWIQNVELQLDPNGGPTGPSYMVLVNLFEITINSSAALHNEVQALWQALATGPHGGNVQLVLDFIISLCLERREQNFVDFAKQIVVFLSSTPAGLKVVEFLLLQITPRAMVQEKREPLAAPPDAVGFPYLADLSLILPGGNKQSGFSLGQLSVILLVDLMVSPVQLAAEHVPLLLQVVFVLWDHYIPMVQEQAREMLIHLLHELVISKMEDDSGTTPSKRSVEGLIDAIRRHEPHVVWAYDASNGGKEDGTLRVPKPMEFLAAEVVAAFAIEYPGIREQWGKVTLGWATSCPVRHVACRSFQIFRCILTSLDQSMMADMLARLSNTIADDESDYQTFSMEILTTVRTIIGALSEQDLLQYPQLFWTTCACLNTIHEREFTESLAMLSQFVDKVDLGDETVVTLLTDSMPPKWEGSFDGVQPLIYQGLRSSGALDESVALLDKLAPLPDNYLVGDSSRILFTVLANLPAMLQALDSGGGGISAQIARADRLGRIAAFHGWDTMAKALSTYAARRYHSSTEFAARCVSAIRTSFFPDFDFRTLVFLMGLLTNKHGWFKIRTMQLLCLIIPEIDMRKPEIASHGPDLISPLLRLLQTPFCSNALEVLDHIMSMPGTPMDKHHLRMSMVGSQSRAIRKEFERTQSLFGIPEETGWSIPMPAIHSTTTRTNVHAVFYTCATLDADETGPVPTPDVEFHQDDFQYGYPFPDQDRTVTMASDDPGRGDGNMGDLVMQLDSLDDFFDDNVISNSTGDPKSPEVPRFVADVTDAGARYEQQTLPLLRKSLKRTASITSLQNGFSDARVPPTRDVAVTSPVSSAAGPTQRPSMRPRVMTTPSNVPSQGSTAAQSTADVLSDEEMDEIFSDDEYRGQGHPTSHEASSSIGSRIRSGTRSGMRRLTGSSSHRDRERQRELIWGDRRLPPGPKSPKVPKIPSNYLQNAHSPNI
ncbi:MAG: hypothetical protein M1825_003137 [Sarcosagium campestre]|nr:MAG: hypothetical protein M1825_003137 [Sarcosagium campestre]